MHGAFSHFRQHCDFWLISALSFTSPDALITGAQAQKRGTRAGHAHRGGNTSGGGNELHRTPSIVVLCWRCEPLAARADLVGCFCWCFKVLEWTWWGDARARLIGASSHRLLEAVGCRNLIYLAFVLSVAASFLLVSLARSPQRFLHVGFCPMWEFGRCGRGFRIFVIFDFWDF